MGWSPSCTLLIQPLSLDPSLLFSSLGIHVLECLHLDQTGNKHLGCAISVAHCRTGLMLRIQEAKLERLGED